MSRDARIPGLRDLDTSILFQGGAYCPEDDQGNPSAS